MSVSREFSELSVWDLDGTIRPGSLLSEAVQFGISEGFVDPAEFADPKQPTYTEVDYFVRAITNRSRKTFNTLTDRISDEARAHSFPWSLGEIDTQRRNGHPIIISHSPDFLVRAFARGIGVNHGHGSYFHTSKHIFSGHAVTSKKGAALSRYMRRHGFESLASGFGDTVADLPVLERADRPVAVNPSPVLAKIAEEKGWEIVEATL